MSDFFCFFRSSVFCALIRPVWGKFLFELEILRVVDLACFAWLSGLCLS